MRKNIVITLALSLFCLAVSAQAASKKLLVVTVTKGFRHSSIPTAEKVLGQIARNSHGQFEVEYARTDADITSKMTMDALKKYDGVIFANTTGDLPLPDKQGFLDWIKSGKAFVGMHSATDTFHEFRPYIDMIGGEFLTHPAGLYDVECLNLDPAHPACKAVPAKWPVKDEIYMFKSYDPAKVHRLLQLDKHPATREPGKFPIAWCSDYGQGHMFYTELGHSDEMWEDSMYQQHILGGIEWALGLKKGSAKPQP